MVGRRIIPFVLPVASGNTSCLFLSGDRLALVFITQEYHGERMTIVRKKRSQLVLWAVKLVLKGVLCTRLSEELLIHSFVRS